MVLLDSGESYTIYDFSTFCFTGLFWGAVVVPGLCSESVSLICPHSGRFIVSCWVLGGILTLQWSGTYTSMQTSHNANSKYRFRVTFLLHLSLADRGHHNDWEVCLLIMQVALGTHRQEHPTRAPVVSILIAPLFAYSTYGYNILGTFQ